MSAPQQTAGALRFKLLLALVVILATGELVARVPQVERSIITPLLYWQAAQVNLHQPSENPELLYELRPNAKHEELDERIEINALGMRGPERSAKKPEGVYRIIALGGSNTYGASVSNDETWPAQLERALNADSQDPRRYEVWNAGVSAYVLSQKIVRAEALLRCCAPDMLIIQHHNEGRRAFLSNYDPLPFLKARPSLYAENLAFHPGRRTAWGEALVDHWAFYRVGLAALCLASRLGHEPAHDETRAHNRQLFQNAQTRWIQKTRVVLFPAHGIDMSPIIERSGLPVLRIFEPEHLPEGAGDAYFDVHPPAHVLRWYGETLARLLRTRGLM